MIEPVFYDSKFTISIIIMTEIERSYDLEYWDCECDTSDIVIHESLKGNPKIWITDPDGNFIYDNKGDVDSTWITQKHIQFLIDDIEIDVEDESYVKFKTLGKYVKLIRNVREYDWHVTIEYSMNIEIHDIY